MGVGGQNNSHLCIDLLISNTYTVQSLINFKTFLFLFIWCIHSEIYFLFHYPSSAFINAFFFLAMLPVIYMFVCDSFLCILYRPCIIYIYIGIIYKLPTYCRHLKFSIFCEEIKIPKMWGTTKLVEYIFHIVPIFLVIILNLRNITYVCVQTL